jgi:methyl-accepting chemotaxis protein
MECNKLEKVKCIIIILVLTILLPVFLGGCGTEDVRTLGSGVAPTNGRISKEDIREQVDNFAEYYKATFRQSANELNERLQTKKVERTTLQMRARMVQGLNAMLDQDDPVIAFIETWALCKRFRIYVEEGEGSKLFAEGQEIVIKAAKRLESEIERVGHIFMKDDVFESTSKNITEFANVNPISGTFYNVIVYATEVKKDQPNPFMSVLNLPMTPFRAMEGVDRTASAIYQFRDTAERFSDVVRELPESSRWQMELLMYDLEEADMVKTFLDSFTKFSESSAKMAVSVEELPEQLGKELSEFVDEVDRKQANLQKTLAQAEKTTLAVNETVEKLNSLAKDTSETAIAWEGAAKATGEVVKGLNRSEEAESSKSSFGLKEYRDAAEQTSQAATDIKELLVAIEAFSESRKYDSLTNHLTYRIMGLIFFAFVLAIAYRIITVRFIKTGVPKA